MTAGAGGTGAVSLEHTPTWAVATVCFFIISISIILEHSIHLLMNWLKRRHKTVLYDAFGRLKSELMLLGFLSLLLAATQKSISKICIPHEMANRLLPCGRAIPVAAYGHWTAIDGPFGELIFTDHNKSGYLNSSSGRKLSGNGSGGDGAHDQITSMNANATDPCTSKGKVSLITVKGVEQLGHFIIVLAVMQIVYSLLTVALGRIQIRRWKAWENETQTTGFQDSNAPNNLRLPRQTTFARRHTSCTETTTQLWIKCFFRQFFNSVAKTDYLTLRRGFIMAHLSARQLNNFNFQKYIQHSLDEDFKVVISISPLMWLTFVIFMLVDIRGWHSYFWISFTPLLLVLTVGTKLEVIVAKMALQLKKQKNVIVGSPLVELNDKNFWFGQPGFVLDLLHLTLFLNAFEMAFFIWVTMEFGFDSCYHENTTTIVRIALAIAVQVICSYITLPLYALVTQMGSQFKGGIFNEKVADVLKQWHTQVRRNRKRKQEPTTIDPSPPTTHVMANGRGLNNSPSKFSAETSHKSKKSGEITEEYWC